LHSVSILLELWTDSSLVNVAETWKVTWCVFFGGGGAFCTLFHNITYLSTPIVGSCWSSQWVVLAACHSYSCWWLDTLYQLQKVWLHSLSCYLEIGFLEFPLQFHKCKYILFLNLGLKEERSEADWTNHV